MHKWSLFFSCFVVSVVHDHYPIKQSHTRQPTMKTTNDDETTAEEDSEYERLLSFKSSLLDLRVNSKPMILMLTELAAEEKDKPSASTGIVKVIEERVHSVIGNQSTSSNVIKTSALPLLYLIDSIVKNVKGCYVELFTQNIVSNFCRIFQKSDEKTRASLFKLRNTWSDVFPAEKLFALDSRVKTIDPAWPVIAVPVQEHQQKKPPFVIPFKEKKEKNSNTNQSEQKRVLPITNQEALLFNNNKRIRTQQEQQQQQQQLYSRRPMNTALADPSSLMMMTQQPIQQPMMMTMPHQQQQSFMQHQNVNYPNVMSSIPHEVMMRQQHQPPSFIPNDFGHQQMEMPPNVPFGAQNFQPQQTMTNDNSRPNVVSNLINILAASLVKPTTTTTQPVTDQPEQQQQQPHDQPIIARIPKQIKQKNQQKMHTQEVAESSPSLSETESLKVPRPSLIGQLFHGRQCTSCPLRFDLNENNSTTKQDRDYNGHLDWHFRLNQKKRNRKSAVRVTRPWFYSFDDWLLFREISLFVHPEEDQDPHDVMMIKTTTAEAETSLLQEQKNNNNRVKVSGSSEQTCVVCSEKFEVLFDEVLEEWFFKDAVEVVGHQDEKPTSSLLMHVSCSSDSSSTTTTNIINQEVIEQQQQTHEEEELEEETFTEKTTINTDQGEEEAQDDDNNDSIIVVAQKENQDIILDLKENEDDGNDVAESSSLKDVEEQEMKEITLQEEPFLTPKKSNLLSISLLVKNNNKEEESKETTEAEVEPEDEEYSPELPSKDNIEEEENQEEKLNVNFVKKGIEESALCSLM